MSHITQSSEWAEFRQKTGIKSVQVADSFLYLHKIPKFPYFIGYLPRLALINEEILNKLATIGKQNNCIFIKIEPELSFNNQHLTFNNNLKASKSILPKHTYFIDLTKSEEELLGAMEPKTRYNIKVAQKHGVIIKQGEEKDLDSFINILEDTERRQGFLSHPAAYYKTLWKILRPEEMVYLLLAYPSGSNQKPIASLMLFKFKDTFYYPYGGSLNEFRNLMPNYLLHWEAIKLGKGLGCKTYDMWGAFLNKPDASDPWFGIYRFKSGFGGKLIIYPDSLDLVVNPLLYKIYLLSDNLRWHLIHLKRKLHL